MKLSEVSKYYWSANKIPHWQPNRRKMQQRKEKQRKGIPVR